MLFSPVRWKLHKGVQHNHRHNQEKSRKPDLCRKTCLWKRTVLTTRSHPLYRGKQMYRHPQFLFLLFLPQSLMLLLLQDSLVSKHHQKNVRVYLHHTGEPLHFSTTRKATIMTARKHPTHCNLLTQRRLEKIHRAMTKPQRPHKWSYPQEDCFSHHPLFSLTFSKESGEGCR